METPTQPTFPMRSLTPEKPDKKKGCRLLHFILCCFGF
jgi:hypothetical protein